MTAEMVQNVPPPMLTHEAASLGQPDVQPDMITNGPPQRSDSPSSIVTIRMVAQGKEVGSIIGKKGENVKRSREESGAKINISDSSCPERIVTLTGAVDQIYRAHQMILDRFDEDLALPAQPNGLPAQHNIRLVIPASQCGSLIGKAGMKIKEIREITGASVQVASDMLPNSTERAVTITGPNPAIANCIKEICSIMLESPPKGATIPYRPKPVIQAPLMYAAAAGAAAQAAYLTPNPQYIQALMSQQQSANPPCSGSMGMSAVHTVPSTSESQARLSQQSPMTSTSSSGLAPSSYQSTPQLAPVTPQSGTPLLLPSQPTPMAYAGPLHTPYGTMLNPGMLGMSGLNMMSSYMSRSINNNVMPPMQTNNGPASPQQTQTSELIIPNELIGCVIGRGGIKINEIRQMSGANIKISSCEEGSSDRKVSISGVPETISLAAYLINSSIELHKHQLLNADPATLAALMQATHTTIPTAYNPAGSGGMLSLASTVSNTMMPAAKPMTVLPYSLASPYGLASNQSFCLAQAYDPKLLLTSANKLKVLPTNALIKQDARFAPY